MVQAVFHRHPLMDPPDEPEALIEPVVLQLEDVPPPAQMAVESAKGVVEVVLFSANESWFHNPPPV
jgi:hypothetical protein